MDKSAEMLYTLRLLVSEFDGRFLTDSQEKALHLARVACAKQPAHLHELANQMEDDERLQ